VDVAAAAAAAEVVILIVFATSKRKKWSLECIDYLCATFSTDFQ
jgi:hypothetical protein